MVLGVEIKNVTTNPGLLASNLGPSKIVEGYHTLTHYYQLTELSAKIQTIKEIFLETQKIIPTDGTSPSSSRLMISTLNSTLTLAEDKLNDLHVTLSSNRQKRGLINGLGSVIKFISGNLDSQDEERYNSILTHLQKNQDDLQRQLLAQYSINEAVQRNFNKTLETINSNNAELKKELSFWKTLNPRYSWYPLFEHHQVVLNLILNTIQDIENSLVACRSGVLHPSVINSHLLYQELHKLSKYYKDKFLNFENQNLFEIESYIKVRCFVGLEEIVYFLDIPIVDPVSYTLYHLEPLPTLVDYEHVMIIPKIKYFLKSHSGVIPLQQRCPSGHLQLCPNYLISPSDPRCEIKFLMNGQTSDCKFIKLLTPGNYAKLMLEVNQYLLFFPSGDTITITRNQNIETRTLFGTYLISPGKDLIEYKNKTLFAPHNEFAGKPLIVGDLNLQLKPDQIPTREIVLKELDLEMINTQDIRPIPKFDFISYAIPDLWTIVIYLILASVFTYTLVQYRRHVTKSNAN